MIYPKIGGRVKMNENIDVRMSNYLTILSNPELKKEFGMETVMAMEKALVIYTSTTAIKYVEEYESKRQKEESKEENSILL